MYVMTNSEEMNLPIDLDFIRQLSDGDVDFELELLETFVEDTKTHIEAAKVAIASQDYFTLRQEAHHMKGASGNVGAHEMYALASELEEGAKQSSLDGAEHIVDQLEEYLAQVESLVADYTV